MEQDLSHSFDLRKSFRIFSEDSLQLVGNLEWAWIFVIYRPISFWNCKTIQFLQRQTLSPKISSRIVNNPIISFRIFYIFDNYIACLKRWFSETHLKQLNIANFLVDAVVSCWHQFLCHHVLVLTNEGLLRTVKTDKDCHQVDLLIFHSFFCLTLLQNLPFLCGIFIFLRTHLLTVLFWWNFDNFSC